MLLDFLYPAVLLVASSGLASPAAAAKPKNAILLSDVQSLTLRAGRQTSHRRVAAMPQLKCVSSRAVCALHEVDTMRCVNQGSGYGSEDIQWSCSASLPPELKLGSTEVMCEGYSSPDDPYVLSGSCGVEYRLVLTEEGSRRYPDLDRGGGGGGSDGNLPAWLFWVFFIAVVCWILYSAFTAQPGEFRGPRPGRNNFWGGGGGGGGPGPGFFGGGGNGWNDPPPPYPGNKPTGSGGGWQPGFWSGLAGGAAAGYMAGNRGRNNTDNNRGYGSFGNSRNTWGGGSSWGGAGGAGPSSSRGSGSSSSSARYESTGFGGTSRR
ncbi:hypothetical protein MCOR03_008737 [Pyricularia oryzae]|nr:hypothetical protein MCOR03_008737 [Pyricularia oryzae]